MAERYSERERAVELVNASLANTVHREVDTSSLGVNVHVCGTRQLHNIISEKGVGWKFHKIDFIKIILL